MRPPGAAAAGFSDMLLAHATWPEVEAYLARSNGVIIPLGSVEQHGPIGVIGTDMLCAEMIAAEIGARAQALVAPVLGYSPAEFNMAFPGTVSLTAETFSKAAGEVVDSLARHGFRRFYFLNAHGANAEPTAALMESRPGIHARIRNWWDFEQVNALRQNLYGAWEGMHATPSEVAVTRAFVRTVPDQDLGPPEQLDEAYLRAHAGDRHGPPGEHRARFPDGRVGSHSDLGTEEHGRQLFEAACAAGNRDYLDYMNA